jgi:hypothetical protein
MLVPSLDLTMTVLIPYRLALDAIASTLPPLDAGSSQIHIPRPLKGFVAGGAYAGVLAADVVVVAAPVAPPVGDELATAVPAPSSALKSDASRVKRMRRPTVAENPPENCKLRSGCG